MQYSSFLYPPKFLAFAFGSYNCLAVNGRSDGHMGLWPGSYLIFAASDK